MNLNSGWGGDVKRWYSQKPRSAMIRLAGQRDIYWDVLLGCVQLVCVLTAGCGVLTWLFLPIKVRNQVILKTEANWKTVYLSVFQQCSLPSAEFCFAVLFELKFSTCLATGLGREGCTKQVFAMSKYTNVYIKRILVMWVNCYFSFLLHMFSGF